MKKIFIGLLIVTGMVSCEKNDSGLFLPELIGTWEWIRTDGGIAFHIHETPATTGTDYSLKFTNDNNVVIYENDEELFSGEYTIQKRKSIYNGEQEEYLQISDGYYISNMAINGIIGIDNDTLTISDNCYDGVGSSFGKLE